MNVHATFLKTYLLRHLAWKSIPLDIPLENLSSQLPHLKIYLLEVPKKG